MGDSIDVLITANDSAGNMKVVTLDFNISKASVESRDLAVKELEMPERGKKYIAYKQREAEDLSAFESKVADAISKRNFKLPVFLGEPDFEVYMDNNQSKAKHLFAVFDDRFPGLNVSGKEDDAALRIRGNQGSPIVFYDGLTIEEYYKLTVKTDEPLSDAPTNISTTEFLLSINPADIQSVEIYKEGKKISKYYEDSDNGIICIYSKPGKNEAFMKSGNGLQHTSISGFTYPEKFVSPEYLSNQNDDFGQDARTTLYWDPNIKTNRRGRAKIGFYNSDDARNIQICVEGITADGIPIFDIHEFGRDAIREKLN